VTPNVGRRGLGEARKAFISALPSGRAIRDGHNSLIGLECVQWRAWICLGGYVYKSSPPAVSELFSFLLLDCKSNISRFTVRIQ